MSSVVTYKNNNRMCFCQIRLTNGERVLISIATVPRPAITISKLRFGVIPTQTIWEYNPTMAGGYESYVRNLIIMFASDRCQEKHPLDAIRDIILHCDSIDEAQRTLLTIENYLRSQAPRVSSEGRRQNA